MDVKPLHLMSSAIIVGLAGLGYGAFPDAFLGMVLGLEPLQLAIKHILRAVMGLYLGLGLFWALGALRPALWWAATLNNVLFMGGIGLGRAVALFLDGYQWNFALAMCLELGYCAWGIYNLRNHPES